MFVRESNAILINLFAYYKLPVPPNFKMINVNSIIPLVRGSVRSVLICYYFKILILSRPGVSLSPPSFHAKKGQLVTLTQTYKTATRNHATQEFNHGLVLSCSTLQDNQMFEVI